MIDYEGMNGLEVLYTHSFVEWDIMGPWGIIALGKNDASDIPIEDDEFQNTS